ncbi:BNR-4 repeat-containing protein [Actinopolymorpha sp. B9G3]|uniref:BNR-4 repeat-containing protein n=1 Tax=Actinopolymorpha sp. B9G3 TaxID=3158970 RepID=UPI0032D91509
MTVDDKDMSAQALPVGGAWCWFGDPRALHHEGRYKRTFVSYISDAGDIVIAQYDHGTGELSTSTLMDGFPKDDHNNPAICVRPDGRIMAFWTGHQYPGVPIYYRRSVLAEDITGGWEPVREITDNTSGDRPGFTYQNLAQLSREPGRLFVFWRGGNFNPTFSTSVDGETWTPATTLISAPGERPYVKVFSDGTDTIHFAFTQAHPNRVRTSIYYMYYRAGSLHRADGTPIGDLGAAIRPDQADLVYDAAAAGPKAWIWDIACDSAGRPILVYATFPSDTDHRYRYARWDNAGSWVDTEITAAGDSISADGNEPNYSGGISLDHANPSVVLLSRQEPGGRHEISRWTSTDQGASWDSVAITSNSRELNVRPLKPHGMRGDGALSVLWMAGEYPSYTSYQTRIMALGEDGMPFALCR